MLRSLYRWRPVKSLVFLSLSSSHSDVMDESDHSIKNKSPILFFLFLPWSKEQEREKKKKWERMILDRNRYEGENISVVIFFLLFPDRVQ